MPKALDLTERRFGRLVARTLDPNPGVTSGHPNWRRRRWLCDCDCGTKNHPVTTYNLVHNTRSCGCLQRDWGKLNGKKLGGRRIGSIICPYCGVEFAPTNRQKFCSRKCKENSELAPRFHRVCAGCGTTIMTSRSDQVFCSRTCQKTYGRREKPNIALQHDLLRLRLGDIHDE